jgi:uncharacterized protein
MAEAMGIRHEIVESNELGIPGFAANPPDRCYLCKRELLKLIKVVAARHGIGTIADGSNADDLHDYRPGRKAVVEMGVASPLLEAGLGKAEIRELSRRFGLPTADQPALACLASRFPYGSRITVPELEAVDAVEEGIRGLGFGQVRVRHHGDLARIEVEPGEIPRMSGEQVRAQVVRAARRAGFSYVALDLQGYRTGSMNEPIGEAGEAGGSEG